MRFASYLLLAELRRQLDQYGPPPPPSFISERTRDRLVRLTLARLAELRTPSKEG